MWYNTPALNTSTQNRISLKCSNCGSELIFVEEVTVTIGNSLYPMTKTTYRCSNQVCQDETDRKVAKNLELKKEREQLKENRLKSNFRISKKAPAI